MKLTKAECERREALLAELREKLIAYNDARNAWEEFREEIQAKIADHIADKSDKWQDSDEGQAHNTWAEAWEEETPEELDEGQIPEYPEEPDAG